MLIPLFSIVLSTLFNDNMYYMFHGYSTSALFYEIVPATRLCLHNYEFFVAQDKPRLIVYHLFFCTKYIPRESKHPQTYRCQWPCLAFFVSSAVTEA